MPPRPLYRWKSFWLGLLVLAFLGWAWVRSLHQMTGLTYKRSISVDSKTWELCHGFNSLFVGWRVDPFESKGFNAYATPFNTSQEIGLVGTVAVEKSGSDFLLFRVAHWFLILLFLVPWVGFLVWRVRRMKRLAGALPAAQD